MTRLVTSIFTLNFTVEYVCIFYNKFLAPYSVPVYVRERI